MSLVKTMVQAIDVLIQASTIAQKAGIFSLEEARIVADAIDVVLGTSEKTNDNLVNEEGTYQPELNSIEEVVEPSSDKFVDGTKPKPRTEADIATFKRT